MGENKGEFTMNVFKKIGAAALAAALMAGTAVTASAEELVKVTGRTMLIISMTATLWIIIINGATVSFIILI